MKLIQGIRSAINAVLTSYTSGANTALANTDTVVGAFGKVQGQLDQKQPLDAELTAIAGLTSAANKTIRFTGSGTAALVDLNNPGSQTLAAALTWTAGAAPSGATNHTYNWVRIGNLVTYRFTITFATAGTTVTGLVIAFPGDMPAPLEPSGLTGASNWLYPEYMQIANGATAGMQNVNGGLRRNSGDSAYEFAFSPASGTYSHFFVHGTYFTA